MISRNYKTEPIKPNPHDADVRQMYNNASAQIMHVTLKPGETLKPHKTPVDVVFYVMEGSPTIHIDKESQVFEKDSLIESPADILHYISNNSQEHARILVVKAPRPEKATKVV